MFRTGFLRLGVVSVLAAMMPGCGEESDTTKPQNIAPSACFLVDPCAGTTITPFRVDASSSSDEQDSLPSLEVCWDWENDGI